ncbi:MAG: 2-oxoglutarate dehydrogenase complex dihydrolipoyllysine-residue succinyltransferase [Bacteroidetes bacterium]|nr:2-oxoglutarate dehydrogenase complex dihydrolipoyllysine-residue succinyltransferase [Bacteroidota bacterium]
MVIEIKVPSPGESITQVQLASWLVNDGDYIEKNHEIAEIDSDKATISITAEESGQINILVQAGETLQVGSRIGTINTKAVKEIKKEIVPGASSLKETKGKTSEVSSSLPVRDKSDITASAKDMHISPLARKIMSENAISEKEILGRYGSVRISRSDVLKFAEQKDKISHPSRASLWKGNRDIERKKMSTLRLKLAERLVAIKNETAMLTTFNEVNMGPVMDIRKQYKDIFVEKFGISLGLMSFFTKAVTEALNDFPEVNATIDGDEIVYHKYADIGIAVSAPKGLVVPVIRNAEMMSMAEIEIKIKDLAERARNNSITLEEMTGGTFTITNGGVFGSMLSTPIINPPQSGILGMHNIIDRSVVISGKVEIRPVMYVALSYDHRIIDGRESVGFLVKVKEMLENPAKMLFGGNDPVRILLTL